MRCVFVCMLVLAAVSAMHASAATSVDPAAPESFFFRVSPLTATPQPADGATRYAVAVTNAPVGNAPFIRWYLDPQPGPTGSPCSNDVLSGGTKVRPGRYVWKNQGLSFVWYHGPTGSYAARKSYGCDQGRLGEHGYPGRVTVVFENDSETCTASFVGAPASEPRSGPPALCALGGYLPLAVPRALLRAYAGASASLNDLLRRAQSGAIHGTQLADAIRSVMNSEANAFQLFPPVWGCRFDVLFQAVLDARTTLGERAANARQAGRSLGQLEAILGRCGPTGTRPVGVPTSVTRAVAGLATRAAAPNDRAQLRAVDVELEQLLATRFPPVLGVPYVGLVDRVLAESSAAALAGRAASSGDLVGATSALARVRQNEQTIASNLRKQAARAKHAERAA